MFINIVKTEIQFDRVFINEAERHRPAPRPGAAPLIPFLAAPRVGQAAVWASVPFGTYQVAGASQSLTDLGVQVESL